VVAPRAVLLIAPAAAVAAFAALGIPAVARARDVARPALSARETFLADCATCHAADGTGTNRGPSLTGVGRASIDYWVSTGRMPLAAPDDRDERHPPRYRRAAQRALVDYVATLTGPGPDIPAVSVRGADLARGGELYRLDCAACHQWGGEGGALLHREAPPLHASTATQVAEAVRVGPGLMPAFGESAVTNRDLSALAAYVGYLRNPDDRGGEPLWHLGPMAEGSIAFAFGLGLLLLASRWIGEKA